MVKFSKTPYKGLLVIFLHFLIRQKSNSDTVNTVYNGVKMFGLKCLYHKQLGECVTYSKPQGWKYNYPWWRLIGQEAW